MNQEQLAYLRAHNVQKPQDIEDVMARLRFTEIDDAPDAVSDSGYNDAQTAFLCGQHPDELGPESRALFDRLGTGSTAAGAPSADAPASQTSRTAGPPRLNVQKLMDIPLSPTSASFKNEIHEWFGVLEADYREAQRGVPEHLRSGRFDIERAKQFCGPYLVA